MKVNYEFNLPDDRNEYKLCSKSADLFVSLWDFSQYLREVLKYKELTEEQSKIYELIREKFYSILEDNYINLNEFE